MNFMCVLKQLYFPKSVKFQQVLNLLSFPKHVCPGWLWKLAMASTERWKLWANSDDPAHE